jgi:hypothetical protein
MSDYYKEMMNYMYSPHGTIDPNFSYSDYFNSFLVDYRSLAFPKKPLVKIYPETLKRCTIGINDAS